MSTYVKIETIELTGSASTLSFTSIPSTYTDLMLKASIRGTDGAAFQSGYMTINGSSSLTNLYLQAYGGGASSGLLPQYYGAINTAGSTGAVFSSVEIYFPNYSGSTYKSFSIENVAPQNSSTQIINLVAGLRSDTAAITSISLTAQYGNIAQYSSATLYGIKND